MQSSGCQGIVYGRLLQIVHSLDMTHQVLSNSLRERVGNLNAVGGYCHTAICPSGSVKAFAMQSPNVNWFAALVFDLLRFHGRLFRLVGIRSLIIQN